MQELKGSFDARYVAIPFLIFTLLTFSLGVRVF